MKIKILSLLLVALCVNTMGQDTSSRGSFVDKRDGKKYKTVKIGEQIWMAENLNYKIDHMVNKISDSYCYENKTANCKKYGSLYLWKDALSACPSGWRLPDVDDFAELIENAGGENAGKNLKAKNGWAKSKGKNCNGSDKFGFSALPGGGLYGGYGFSFNLKQAGFWTSTKRDDEYAYYMFLYTTKMDYLKKDDRTWYNDECDAVGIISAASSYSSGVAFSVRCIKDGP